MLFQAGFGSIKSLTHTTSGIPWKLGTSCTHRAGKYAGTFVGVTLVFVGHVHLIFD